MPKLVIGSSVLLAMFAGLPISGQTATAASSPPVSTSHVQAQLLNGVKAAKAKANDPVRAQTMTPIDSCRWDCRSCWLDLVRPRGQSGVGFSRRAYVLDRIYIRVSRV